MKVRISQKDLKETVANIVADGYCAHYALKSMLERTEKIVLYVASSEGWSCDVFARDGIAYTTGYNPVGKHASANPRIKSILDMYDKKAERLVTELYHSDPCEYGRVLNKMKRWADRFFSELRDTMIEIGG